MNSYKREAKAMKVIKSVMVGNNKAVLFSNGNVGYAGQVYENGMGCNLSVLKALGL
ncbi:MAG TPA: hypothetical protein VFM18_23960 [Methanosarcina sp.]|nr:hypothetical protein [Methanosarcina sp.]